jgi:hypothetical protein
LDHDLLAEQELADRPVYGGAGWLVAEDTVEVVLVELRGKLVPGLLELSKIAD